MMPSSTGSGAGRIHQPGIHLLAARDPVVQVVEHIARHRYLFGRSFQAHAVPARRDVHAQPAFQRDQVPVILAEQLRQQLRLVEQHFHAASVADLRGNGLAAHAVLSGKVMTAKVACGARLDKPQSAAMSPVICTR
jgi:hypothetical protein